MLSWRYENSSASFVVVKPGLPRANAAVVLNKTILYHLYLLQ